MYIATTLTLSTSAQSLWTLLTNASITPDEYYARELTIQATSDNTGVVRVGDSNLNSSNRCGVELQALDSRTYRLRGLGLDLRQVYVLSTQSGDKINVEVTKTG